MLSMGYTICMIVVCAFCTFAERLLPFLIFRKGSVPNLVRYLGNILPVAVMATLVIYCLRAVDFSSILPFSFKQYGFLYCMHKVSLGYLLSRQQQY